MKVQKLATSLIGFATLLPVAAFASEQYDLVLPGIAGTESVAGFTNLIPLDSFSFAADSGELRDLFVERPVDSVSPLLEQAAVTNRHFGAANLYVFGSEGGGTPQLYFDYTLSNVTTLYELVSDDGGPLEEAVGFAFQNATVSAVPLPDAAWLLVSGLGGLGFVTRRRVMA